MGKDMTPEDPATTRKRNHGPPQYLHKELELILLESRAPAKCRPFFLLGMFIARPVMVGDESGEDSASVELWRCVAARENSRPRDLLGSTLVGDP